MIFAGRFVFRTRHTKFPKASGIDQGVRRQNQYDRFVALDDNLVRKSSAMLPPNAGSRNARMSAHTINLFLPCRMASMFPVQGRHHPDTKHPMAKRWRVANLRMPEV